MKSLLLALIVVGLGGYSLICGYFYVQQRSLLYYPVPARGLTQTMEVGGAGDGVKASVSNGSGRDALVYFGGNAEDVSVTALEMTDRFPDHAIYALHYRGYGDSAGNPTESGLVGDASALLDFAISNHDRVRVVGRSLGSGVALQAVVGRPVDGLTLITPFGSIREIASRIFPYLPVSILIKDPYDSVEHAGRLTIPVRVIVAEHDEVIPRWSTDDLIHSLPEYAKVSVLQGRDHNDIQLDSRYWELIGGE